MYRKALIVGMGWQGRRLAACFQRLGMEVVGVCRTQESRAAAEGGLGIEVRVGVERCEDTGADLVVCAAFPLDQQRSVARWALARTSADVLVDMPITFDPGQLDGLFADPRAFGLFIDPFGPFRRRFSGDFSRLVSAEVTLRQCRANLAAQPDPRGSVMADALYALSNLLGADFGKVRLSYAWSSSAVKDIEYAISADFGAFRARYKFEDGRGVLATYAPGRAPAAEVFPVVYDEILPLILSDFRSTGQARTKREYSDLLRWVVGGAAIR